MTHDLVDDIVGKGRDEIQFVDIVEDLRELDMLIALARVLALQERVCERLGAE
jgi:hypothetical protein